MKSQTSFFNKAVVRSNLKRYGYLGILFFVFTCIISNIGLLVNGVGQYRAEDLYNSMEMMVPNPFDIAMIFIVPVILGIVLFRYIMEERALSTIHAMPVSRKSLFFSQFLTFEILYGVPILVNGIISWMILLGKGYPIAGASGRVGYSILILFISGCAVFGLTVLFGMLVGSSVLQTALVYILMGAPFIIVELSRVLIQWTLKGYPEYRSGEALHHYLTPYYSIAIAAANAGDNLSTTAWAFIMVVIFLVIGYGGSYVLYQKRDLESHTELIAFNKAKNFFVGLLTLMMTLSLSTLIGSMMDGGAGAYIGLIMGALIGFAITKMIAEKTVAVLKYWKQGLIVTAAFVVVLGAVDMDFLGYESRVPDTDDVAYVFYKEDMWTQVSDYDDMEESLRDNRSGGIFREKATIELVRDLHQEAIEEVNDEFEVWHNFTVVYVLKNGRQVHRVYNVGINPESIKNIHESAEYKRMNMALMKENVLDGNGAVVTVTGINNKQKVIEGSDLISFLNAYELDYNRMSYIEELGYNQMGYVEVAVIDRVTYNGDNRSEQRRVFSYPIFSSFEATKVWMTTNDMSMAVPTSERVTSATIGTWHGFNFMDQDEFYYEERMKFDYNDGMDPSELVITDADQLKELFNLGYDYTRMYEEAYTITFTFATGGNYTVRVVDLPQDFMSYIQPW